MTSTYTKPSRRVITDDEWNSAAFPSVRSTYRKPTKLTTGKQKAVTAGAVSRTASSYVSKPYGKSASQADATSMDVPSSADESWASDSDKDLRLRHRERKARLKERRKAAKAAKKAERKAAKGPHTYRFIASTVAVLAVVAISVVWLYPVSKEYYTNLRENQRLKAELDAVQTRNDTITKTINNLQTDEGIEDQARSEFGWVMTGDNAVNVTNIGDITSPTELPSQVDSSTVEAPSNWLTLILDKVFGVE